jgi:acetyl-CoA synthetase
MTMPVSYPPGGNRPSYLEYYHRFRTDQIVETLSGSLSTGINACFECCDRHAPSGKVALEWESQDGRRASYTFGQLRDMAAKFANYLKSRGVGPGDVVAGMLPRTPELLVTILGTWRAGAVYQPLFTAFGPKAIDHRLQISGAKLIVTDPVNRSKLDEVKDLPTVAIVARTDKGERAALGDDDFHRAMSEMGTEFAPVLRFGDDSFLLMSTSGTTGLAKGVPVPLRALLSFQVYMTQAVDLRPDDKFWNIADPGWAYGLYYSVTGPLLLGHATTFYDGPFTVESTYRIIKTHGISNLAGSPTAFRMLIAAGPEAAAPVQGQLRVVSSAGEPLNPEVIRWFAAHLDAPIYDHYGQTELGMVVNTHHGLDHAIQVGAAGLSMPGYRVVVLDGNGNEAPPNTPGELSVDLARSPLHWFCGYLNQPTPSISGGYYRTGDLAECGPDGHLSFVGRNDDVITSAGYRIGPFDVESALIEHPAVTEVGVIGRPDVERTEIVKAFVVLQKGYEPSNELTEELSQFVKKRLSAHAYPREIAYVMDLPKTPSGKLQRFILRNNEKALQEGKPVA